ncbi:hypothetical protein K1T71_001595 [Dendrolimus kikuchii]|uniref:Uncharacterized protein n=1 Tax=Dendrolimus kikuchii TaxID=765133 RepID=A0ACC1DEI0_9NEOP|nr:hypothetical protein K1T71_001595 [Dendrolimus kikuchii]
MFVRFALLALVAAAAAVPATDRPIPPPITTITDDDIGGPWFSFPSLSSIFAPLFKLIPSFAEVGPRVIADDDKFQIIMNGLKNYNKDDLKVKTKGSFVFIQGSREVKQDDRDLFASHFYHTFLRPENAKSSDVTANLYSDGTLVVTAILSPQAEKTKDEDRDIPVIETGVPYENEGKEDDAKTTVAAPPAPSTAAPEEGQKEPTTPEDATEKDNVIPHGNEIVNP